MIVVGAPVHQRDWVLGHWFESIAAQTVGAENITILLNYGRSSDATFDLIVEECGKHRFADVVTLYDNQDDHRATRKWNPERYETMVRLRNDLLDRVRTLEPSYYFSCDTDILLTPVCIKTLIEHLGEYEAIAPLTHMTPTGYCPNAFGLNGQRAQMLTGLTEVRQMFAVFGAVLMTPTMYERTEYALHRQGEDIGWATSAWSKQLKMALDPTVRAKHVMNREMLTQTDIRIGF